MPHDSRRTKEGTFNFRLPADLKEDFMAAADAADRPAAQVLRDFMRAYVERQRQAESGHDDWFRAQVQAAIDDPRPSIPHDAVMERTRSVIDRIAAEKTRRAG